MRHVCGIEGWEGWEEGDGLMGMEEEGVELGWGAWVEEVREQQAAMEGGGEDEIEEQMGNNVHQIGLVSHDGTEE